MAIYLAALFALWALVAAVGGIAAIAFGWVLPNIRSGVRYKRAYGVGALAAAVGMSLMAAGEMASSDLMHSAERTVGVLILAFSIGLIRASKRPAGTDLGALG
ncbi:hypothetical protein [Streptomyces rhizosphaerihabitans]|uniref:hypothetical protein n=1 Tax=Streptomyces rhizosphaerihabitans TaxID=1266770 RepID=UPI0021C05B79|nr:hypothetical protein [Streptomyces rhizosphaerihabitans]MCT9003485.1 hypothetical protein [Streptomyces rhizosphaerihabitans]